MYWKLEIVSPQRTFCVLGMCTGRPVMPGRGRCREIRIQILNILNILNLTCVLKTLVISNILNILNILNLDLGLSRQCTCWALECNLNKTNKNLRIVSPQRTFCVLETYKRETYRRLEIVSPQRTFCVRGVYDVQIQKIQNIQNIGNHTCLQPM